MGSRHGYVIHAVQHALLFVTKDFRMPTILVVEDEPAIQTLLEVTLRSGGYEVAQALDAERGAQMAREMVPHLILVDWMLPGQSGVSLVRGLRASDATREVPVIMLTGRAQEYDKVMGLESGADDYVTKPFGQRELLARIGVLLRRPRRRTPRSSLAGGGLSLDPATQRVLVAGVPLPLSPTEFRLLHFFMKFPERVHSREVLLDQVWGGSGLFEDRTVDVHVARLRNALQDTGRHDMIETIRGIGYRLSLRNAVPQVAADL